MLGVHLHLNFLSLAQWTALLFSPWLFLALYIYTNDRKLKRIPDSAKFFSPKRVSVRDVREMDERIRREGGHAGIEARLKEGSGEGVPGRTGRRYIVVGGGGFLGGWIVTKLIDRGEELGNIRIIDIAPPSGHHVVKDAMQKGLQFMQVDVTDAQALEAAFRAPWPSIGGDTTDSQPEITVFHTAANIRFYERHAEFLPRSERVNIGGTQNVLAASRAIGASVLVYTSSGSVGIHSTRLLLWPWEKEPEKFVQVVNDDDGRVPKRHEDFFSNYAATKIRAERMVREADGCVVGEGKGMGKVMRTGCIRPGNGIFGPRGDMLCGAYLVRQTNPTWIGTVVQSFSYVENCAIAHLCYEARLIELQSGSTNPDIGGQAFCVADPGTTPTYGDAYTTLETLSDGECTFPTLSPTVMLLFSHAVEKYYRAQYWLASRGWWVRRLLPEVKGEIINLQPALFYLTSVHLIFDDSRARLAPEKGGLGYQGAWTTLEGLHKTVEEYKSGLHKVDNRSAGIGLKFFGGQKKRQTVKVMPTPVAPVELVIPPQQNERESNWPVMSSDVSSNWHAVRPWAPSLSLTVREVTSVSATFILSSAYTREIDPSLAEIGLEAAAQDDSEQHQDPNGNGSAPSASTTGEGKPPSVIADALAKGLSVNVNGSAWPRAFIRIDDQLDEAVIIIYALMPGRQYDIELALASVGQPSTPIRKQVTTEDDSDQDTAEINTDPESPTPDNSTASDPHSTPSTSPSRTVPGTPPTTTNTSAANNGTTAPQLTLEDRLNQLQHTLSTINAERETLLASLKSARRDAQKADSALRSEIDTLKRASEKNAAAEVRGKQKVLALQEAVKRAQNSTREMEEMTEEVESVIPDLKAQREAKESAHRKVKSEAERVRKEREDLEEKDRKRLEGMKSELASLTNKLEKLGGKRDKLEGTVIPDLEEKLKEVAKEIETEEQELSRLEEEERQVQLQAELQRTLNGHVHVQQQSPQAQVQVQAMDDNPSAYAPSQRPRYYSHGDKQGRPTPAPIQRPHAEYSSSSSGGSGLVQSASNPAPIWNPPNPNMPLRQQTLPQAHPHGHHLAQAQGQGMSHNPRAHSFHTSASVGNPHSHSHSHQHQHQHQHPFQGTPIILTNTQRKGSAKSGSGAASNSNSINASNAPPISGASNPNPNFHSNSNSTANSGSNITNTTTTSSPASNTTTSFTSSPPRISPTISGSTLSSRAPAFEPSRPLASANLKNATSGHGHGHKSNTGAGTHGQPGITLLQRPVGANGLGRGVVAGSAGGGGKSGAHVHR